MYIDKIKNYGEVEGKHDIAKKLINTGLSTLLLLQYCHIVISIIH